MSRWATDFVLEVLLTILLLPPWTFHVSEFISYLAPAADGSGLEFHNQRRVIARCSLGMRVPEVMEVVQAQHLRLGSDAEQMVKGLRHAAGAMRGLSPGREVIRQAELSKGAVWTAGEDALNCVVPLMRRSSHTARVGPRLRRGLHLPLFVKAEPLTLAHVWDRRTV